MVIPWVERGVEALVAETEVAVWLTPPDLLGEGLDHAESLFCRIGIDDALPTLLRSRLRPYRN